MKDRIFEKTGFRKEELLKVVHTICIEYALTEGEQKAEEVRRMNAIYDFISEY